MVALTPTCIDIRANLAAAIQLSAKQSRTLVARTGGSAQLPHYLCTVPTSSRHRSRSSLAERASHAAWFATRADLTGPQWWASQRLWRLAAGTRPTDAAVLWAL